MSRELLHIYGPFSIQSFGLAIAIGLIVFSYLVLRDPRRKALVSADNFFTILFYGIIAAALGGRFLALVADWSQVEGWIDLVSFWQGGFSLLGSVIAVMIVLPCCLYYLKVPIFPFLDLVALYAPLLQALSRLGCLMAGCCFGAPCSLPWAITYTDTQSFAPLHESLHPTQLYSSLLLFCLFLLLYFVGQRAKKPGQLFSLYLAGLGIERFFVDFLRADREFGTLPYFSIHQWIACSLVIIALFMYASMARRKEARLGSA